MGRNSGGKGLAVFALLMGLGGLALGAYSVFLMPSSILQQADDNNPISHIWTKQQAATYYPSTSYADVTDMRLTITVAANETVYIMFSGEFWLSGGSPTWFTGAVRLTNNNAVIASSERSFTITVSGPATPAYSMETSCIIEGLTAGSYEIELQATANADSGSDSLINGLLTVFTYK